MNAARIHEFGEPSVLRYEEAPAPAPAGDQILIRVQAAGINPVDGKIRSGNFGFRPELPAILGRDVSGIVEESTIKDFAVGDEVFGMVDYHRGTYAEYAVAAPDEIVKKTKQSRSSPCRLHRRGGIDRVAGALRSRRAAQRPACSHSRWRRWCRSTTPCNLPPLLARTWWPRRAGKAWTSCARWERKR